MDKKFPHKNTIDIYSDNGIITDYLTMLNIIENIHIKNNKYLLHNITKKMTESLQENQELLNLLILII